MPTAARPWIGLTTYREPAAWGVWNETADLLPRTYADAVSRAGGAAVLLPPAGDLSQMDDAADAVLDRLDGLVLTGGADVDPARYGAEPAPETGAPRTDRDSWELALVRAALRREVPVLAICRGLQVLNVALGGTLVQHVPDVVGHDGHCPVVGVHGRHPVRIDPASTVGVLVGAEPSVATYHHQAVDELGAGLTAVGWAEDGTIEAVVADSAYWVIGVQWHPETHDDVELFGGLVAAAAQFRGARGNVH